MSYLLDTGIALIAMSKPDLLSRPVREAIEQGPAYLSVIAYWEVVIKTMKGTLNVGNPHRWFEKTRDALALRTLVFRPEHVSALSDLPPIHQDPFDRALIAQAISEDLILLTTDGAIPKYAAHSLRVIR